MFPFFSDIDLNGNQIHNFTPPKLSTPPSDPAKCPLYVDISGAIAKLMFYNGSVYIDLGFVPSDGFTPRGVIDASTNPAYPATPANGDVYLITVAGTVGGVEVEVGEMLYYINSQWIVQQANLVAASQTQVGYSRFATQAETNAGTLDNTSVSPLTLAGALASKGYARKYPVEVTADGTASTFTIDHQLGSEDVVVSVRGVVTKTQMLVENETNAADPTGKVDIKFAVPPANGFKFRVTVIG